MLLRRNTVWSIVVIPVLLLTAACIEVSPTLSESAKNLAIDEIMGYPEVLGAAVGQDGMRLTLAVVVPFGASEAAAKDAGDDFVRVVKSLGPESAPDQDIGEGDFDYLVTVVYPDRTVVVRGTKASSSAFVIWPKLIHPQNLPQVSVVPRFHLPPFLTQF